MLDHLQTALKHRIDGAKTIALSKRIADRLALYGEVYGEIPYLTEQSELKIIKIDAMMDSWHVPAEAYKTFQFKLHLNSAVELIKKKRTKLWISTTIFVRFYNGSGRIISILWLNITFFSNQLEKDHFDTLIEDIYDASDNIENIRIRLKRTLTRLENYEEILINYK